MDTATGRIRNMRQSVRRAPYPISTLQQTAIATINVHAARGTRFPHAACVYPCEFNTSFIPETASATTGVGSAAAARTVVHKRFCKSAVSVLILASSSGLRVV